LYNDRDGGAKTTQVCYPETLDETRTGEQANILTVEPGIPNSDEIASCDYREGR
jgi:hypothetical protein